MKPTTRFWLKWQVPIVIGSALAIPWIVIIAACVAMLPIAGCVADKAAQPAPVANAATPKATVTIGGLATNWFEGASQVAPQTTTISQRIVTLPLLPPPIPDNLLPKDAQGKPIHETQ